MEGMIRRAHSISSLNTGNRQRANPAVSVFAGRKCRESCFVDGARITTKLRYPTNRLQEAIDFSDGFEIFRDLLAGANLDLAQRIAYKQEESEARYVVMTIPRVPLPEILPVFPLTGVLLLPGTVQPLHVFEPRYRNLVEDALDNMRVFGMIQPFTPQRDNRPLAGAESEKPVLYKVGCAGHIERWERLPDGRFFLQLRGVNRFRFNEELPLVRGYRCVKALYHEFPDATLHEGWQCERQAILQALARYGQAHGMDVQSAQGDRFTDLELVNLLGVSLPFHSAEKQALLEALTLKDRETVLIDLLRLDAWPDDSDDDSDEDMPSRTVN